MFVAGDDPDAKRVAMDLAAELGFMPEDAGGLVNATALEQMVRVWLASDAGPTDEGSGSRSQRAKVAGGVPRIAHIAATSTRLRFTDALASGVPRRFSGRRVSTSQDGESPNFAIGDQAASRRLIRCTPSSRAVTRPGRTDWWPRPGVAFVSRWSGAAVSGSMGSSSWRRMCRGPGISWQPRSMIPNSGSTATTCQIQFNEGDEPSSLDAVELRDRPPGPLAGWDLPAGRRYVAVTKSTIASTRPSASAWLSSA